MGKQSINCIKGEIHIFSGVSILRWFEVCHGTLEGMFSALRGEQATLPVGLQ